MAIWGGRIWAFGPGSAKNVAMAAVVAAGLCGMALDVAGDHSLLRTALVAVFLLFAPTLAVARALPGMDRLARLMIALLTTVLLLTAIASVMLATGLWSPAAGVLVVAVLTAGFLAAAAEPPRRRFRRAVGRGRRRIPLPRGLHLDGHVQQPSEPTGLGEPFPARRAQPAPIGHTGDMADGNTTSPMSLGRLEPVDPREVWDHEAQNFTPWLRENADRLAEALGIELELEAIEYAVDGDARGVIGRDKTNGAPLIVENQLGDSDHTHLGQLLSSGAGTGASTIVWITTRLRDEHRQALAWLNEHTDAGTRFFGIELEVVRIGDSMPAPLLKRVGLPNDSQQSAITATAPHADGGKAEA